jgi:hypothetical protein
MRGMRLQGHALATSRTVDMRRRDVVGICIGNVAGVPKAGSSRDGGVNSDPLLPSG